MKMTQSNENPIRKIIHIDMDAFFASVEQRDFPEYKGKPLVVGSPSLRGVIAAASYEARKFGIHSAMPSQIAIKKCPPLIFRPHRFDVYKAVSSQIMDILHEYTDLVEPLSIDEAFMDVTTNKKNHRSATIIARELKQKIKEKTELTASAGISINKFLAKIASDQDKPDGLFVIKPDDVLPFIEKLEVNKFFGVGKKTAEKMNSLGIYTGKDMQKWSLQDLIRYFGKTGNFFYSICRGIDNRPVQPNRERKSVGIENTFHRDIETGNERQIEINKLIDGLWKRLQRSRKFGRTITLKVKFNDFKQITHSRTVNHQLDNIKLINSIANDLLADIEFDRPIRLMGLSISNLVQTNEGEPYQLTIDFD